MVISLPSHAALQDPRILYLTCKILFSGALLGFASTLPSRRSAVRRRPDLAAMAKISSMVNRSLDLGATLSSSLREIMEVIGADAGTLRIVTASNPASPASVYSGFSKPLVSLLEEFQADSSILEQTAQNQSLHLEDMYGTADAETLVKSLRNDGFVSFSLYPLRSGNKVLGTLGLASRTEKGVTTVQADFIGGVTEILGVAVLNGQLREQATKLSDDLVALQAVNKIISQSFDLEDIIRRIVVEGKRLAKTSQCHLFLLDERLQRLVGSASTQDDYFDIRDVEVPLSERSPMITALMEKRVIAIDEIPSDESDGQSPVAALRWRAAIFAPLLTKDQAIGVLICSDDSRERMFTQEEMLRAETLAHQAAIALENVHLFQVVSRSQKEWETTFDAMRDCVSVHDTTGKVIRANLALARHLKTTPQKVIGKYCSEIYNPPPGGTLSPCRHIRSLQNEALVVEEVEPLAMGGTFEISVNPWYDKNNRLAGSIHVAKDISNEKHLQQQLIQSEKLSAIGELISGIAHELNNPLTGVMGYSQLLQLRADLDDRAKESLLKINNLALRCQKIVQNLLSFARKQKPERKLCDINEILEKTFELRNYELQVNNIETIRDLDRSLPRTIVDAHQIQQVFLNVITNAEQAMLEARCSGRLTIRTRNDSTSRRIIVEIIDDGPGIPEAHLSKIFDPFFTTKEVGKGTGLGLSLSYGIIKEHGGNIYVRSRVGEGSTFAIELPVIVHLQDEVLTAPKQRPSENHFENLVRGKRILVVDDEKYILDFFVEVFQMYPMHVDAADNGRAAVEKMKAKDYDVVFTDFKMPQMGGRELFQWVQEHRPQMATRIVFVTGDTISGETRSFFDGHSTRYLEKPFKIEEVKELIQQTLESNASPTLGIRASTA
jgi:two-component system NtrC family sensor kinase